jgi:hypothetical protein
VPFNNETKIEIRKVMDFTAGEIIAAILPNEGEARIRNNQRFYDMICDMMKDFDLNKMVLDMLRKKLDVK